MDEKGRNPFEEMEDHQIRNFFEGPTDRKIKSGLDGTLGTVRFLGNIADVYLSRFVDTVVGMASANSQRDEESTPSSGRLDPDQTPGRDKKYPNL
ncbi:hypothetical protein [Lewinella cohaerens]|uniref:hypothetical protein n=1 Tax=Lewinella cohaerens TaxID=70995 RepID=UPI000362A6F0|nr:hypothetical protein [Lewinella cohaerens]